MKIPCFHACACLLFSGLLLASEGNPYAFQEGDIVFSSSSYGQGRAIMEATGSKYTHCGVVLQQGDRLMVIEAVEPVRITSLETFISHSDPGTLIAKRLKTKITPEAYQHARTWAVAQIGKNYDDQFLWDDKRMYCSELVWKIYQQAGVRLCEPRMLRDYQLDKPTVQQVIKERYGSLDRIPLDEKVVAPGDIAGSPLLEEAPRTES